MDLGERKRKILSSVVKEYIVGAEPVGSRHIARRYDLGLSSATIRNEMADLEEMGYLAQPHTSAGRIPSDKGYRFYVNELMGDYQLTMQELAALRESFQMRIDRLDRMIDRLAQVISGFTGYTTALMGPEMARGTIKSIELLPIDAERMLIVLVTNEGTVNHRQLKLPEGVTAEFVATFSHILKEKLTGVHVGEITLQRIGEIKDAMGQNYEMLFPVLDFISDIVRDLDSADVHLGGAANILNFPEYSDIGKARAFFDFLGDTEAVKDMFRSSDGENDISIRIGTENQADAIRDCSIITANYCMGDQVMGKIGVIGPTRMDYARTVAQLQHVTKRINRLLYELYFDDRERNHGEKTE